MVMLPDAWQQSARCEKGCEIMDGREVMPARKPATGMEGTVT